MICEEKEIPQNFLSRLKGKKLETFAEEMFTIGQSIVNFI